MLKKLAQMDNRKAGAAFPADDPGSWPKNGWQDLLAISWRAYAPLQLEAMQWRLVKPKDKIQAFERPRRAAGREEDQQLGEALPLFFDHRVYKSYPITLIESRDLPKLTGWLNRLTTSDLMKVDLSGLRTVDAWLTRLDEFGMMVGHSTGATGS
jgi:hypothetical protein